MIENFLRPATQNRPDTLFKQDGATAHTAKETMQLLRQCFGERIISRYGNVNWPSRSPDLTSPDFFLWGYLKERVYVNKQETLEQLKENIDRKIREVAPETLAAVLERARLCKAENGRHLKDVIFHK
ncbi:hypothetical protein Pcinc_030638 [Petrolisthes cinctipes]|uniref:Transposase n=1 Tax=Petrolisthes cinctipes TaxID=88211 RepID=A0AAE1EYC0_PETCI|nr:hypothetical protein Pcinc_030638 [Petrolisthes cinctipes]